MINDDILNQIKEIRKTIDFSDNIEKALYYIKEQYNYSPIELLSDHTEFYTKYYKKELSDFEIYDASSQTAFEKKIDEYFDIYSRGTHRGRTRYYDYNLENETEV
jgi:hypothetical protein